MQKHEKIYILTDSGERVEAQAPVVISASRATDIPAFYSQWFVDRIRSGYVVWYNPFNRQPVYVSFRNCKVVVFWTKNPKPLLPLLKDLDERGIHYYFQFTLNDYEKEGFEINLPPLYERIEIFKELSNQIGKEKVIWRYDPIIVTPTLSPSEILKRIAHIGDTLKAYTNHFVFSFIDILNYRKVQHNLVKSTSHFTCQTIKNAELTSEQMHQIAEGLANILSYWKREGYEISLATCAEYIDLEQYGISHNRCIDSELMKAKFSEDKELVRYLNFGSFSKSTGEPLSPEKLKDKGQRKVCSCMFSKDIGMYNSCRHACVYCYANQCPDLFLSHHPQGGR